MKSTILRAVIAHVNMEPDSNWFAVGITENLKPVMLSFANKREFDGVAFGKRKGQFQVKAGDTVILDREDGWINDDHQLVTLAWALSDEKLTLSLALKAVAETKPASAAPKAKAAAKSVAAKKAGRPLKLTVGDDRMVRLKLTEWEPGESNQLFYGKLTGGQTDGLRGWLSRKGMPDQDFTFEVERSAKSWVPADKAVIKLLADALEPAGV